jgi:hypothetical protein
MNKPKPKTILLIILATAAVVLTAVLLPEAGPCVVVAPAEPAPAP